MGLPMPNDEIVVRYRQAKNKEEQVQFLAELNACPVERIIGILTANGVDNRCFNRLHAKLKKQEEAAAKKADKLRDYGKKQIAAQAEVAEKMQEVLYGQTGNGDLAENAADKQQGFEDIDLVSIGGRYYEDTEIIDRLGRKVHALIDHRRELVAELEDIDAMLGKYAYMISDISEAISCEGVEL